MRFAPKVRISVLGYLLIMLINILQVNNKINIVNANKECYYKYNYLTKLSFIGVNLEIKVKPPLAERLTKLSYSYNSITKFNLQILLQNKICILRARATLAKC